MLTDQNIIELQMLKYSKEYKFEFISGNESMIDSKGRVINHVETTKCVPYTIRITNLKTNEIKEINSSIMIPSSLDIDLDYITKR